MTQEGVAAAASAAMATGARAEARKMRDFAKCIVMLFVGVVYSESLEYWLE